MVTRKRMPVERGDLPIGGVRQAPRGAKVGARERLPMERGDVYASGAEWRQNVAVQRRSTGQRGLGATAD